MKRRVDRRSFPSFFICVTLAPMKKKRRNQPDYYLERHRTSVCLCGCLRPVTGRQLYAKASCRKGMQRLRDRLESKTQKRDPSKDPDFFYVGNL